MKSAPHRWTTLTLLAVSVLFLPASLARADGGFVAMVEGEPISRYEFDRELRRRTAALQQEIPAEALSQQQQELRKRVLEDLILKGLLLQRCDQEKIEVTEDQIDAFLDQRIALHRSDGHQIRDRGEFLRQVAEQSGESEREVRDFFRDELRLGQLYRTRVFRDNVVSTTELRRIYLEDRESFATETTHVFRMLLVWRSNPDAEQLLEQVETQLSAGTSFEDLIAKFSQGPKRDEGGLYERTDTELDSFYRPLPEVVRGLEPGMITPRVASPHAVHLIQLVRRDAGKHLSFEEAQEQIRQRILENRRKLQIQRFEDDLRGRADIRILIEL